CFPPPLDLADPGLRRILRLMVPAVIGLSATQINIFVNTNFASSLAQGSVSWLNYAFRLVQFPIGVFGVAISIATLPVIARFAAVKDFVGLRETYVSSLTIAFCLTIPATVGLYLLAGPIIGVIFEHGNFTAFDTIKTAEALSFYALGLFAYSSVKIMVPVFYALDDTRYPVIGSFLAVGGNILIILLCIDSLQHRAIALATSSAMACNFLFLSVILYRKLNGYSLSYLAVGLAKVMMASLLMGGWLVLARGWLAGLDDGMVSRLFSLLLLIGSGGAVYGVALYLLRLRELTLLVDRLGARLAPGWRGRSE
ncbi:MAG: polysaccharide biosynthesis C-terminal domain-containing protein, partial [Desulfobulbaceae bacterium]|nr:polysaccharide biosynthesis C-terminal domain-containing protein [Desulfobulbaceae bacterium]